VVLHSEFGIYTELSYCVLNENACKVLVGRYEGEGLLGRPWYRWKDNIDLDLKEIGRMGVEWIQLAHNGQNMWAVVNVVLNVLIP
jgi:hypothetical protein